MDRLADRVWHAIRRGRRALAGSCFLAEKVRSSVSSARVQVLPSSVDLAAYRRAKTHTDRTPVTVGWIGSAGNLADLDLVAPSLDAATHAGRIRLQVVCDERPPLGFDFDYRPWSLARESEVLYGIDIGIMPLHSDERSQGRCGYKAIRICGHRTPRRLFAQRSRG